MRLFDKTYTTEDEAYDAAGRAAENIERALRGLKLDSHNHIYVVRVTVDRVDETEPEYEDDED